MSAVQAQKKPGGAGVKLFQAIKAVNQGCSVTLPLPRRARKSIFKKITTYNVILRSLATKNLSDIAVFVKKILRLCSG